MSTNNVNIQYRRGGRDYRRRTFSLDEIRESTLGNLIREDGLTTGLSDFDVYVTHQDSESEIAANNLENSLESILRSASEDGEISGSYVVDVTAVHRGA
jgi:hypothetical protein